jgi:hypothetical protein
MLFYILDAPLLYVRHKSAIILAAARVVEKVLTQTITPGFKSTACTVKAHCAGEAKMVR